MASIASKALQIKTLVTRTFHLISALQRYIGIKQIIFLFYMPLLLGGCVSSKIFTAKSYWENNDYINTRRILKEIIEDNETNGIKGDYAFACYFLGYIEGERQNIDEMISNFDKSISVSDKYKKNIEDGRKYHWMVFFNKGTESYNKGDFNNSKKYFEIALKINPNEPETMKNLATVNTAIMEQTALGINNLTKENKAGKIINEKVIATFSGNGIMNTKPFVAAGPWEIHWNSEGSIFQVYLYSVDGELVQVLAGQTTAGEGVSYFPKKGEYYLSVNTDDNWTISIINAN